MRGDSGWQVTGWEVVSIWWAEYLETRNPFRLSSVILMYIFKSQELTSFKSLFPVQYDSEIN